MNHGQHAGVAQQHFIHAARGRVALEGGEHVTVQQEADRRQRGRELMRVELGPHSHIARAGPQVPLAVAQFKLHLRQQ